MFDQDAELSAYRTDLASKRGGNLNCAEVHSRYVLGFQDCKAHVRAQQQVCTTAVVRHFEWVKYSPSKGAISTNDCPTCLSAERGLY